MIIGVSASRHGLSDEQKRRCRKTLDKIHSVKKIVEFHHGDCVGGDVDFALLVHTMGDRPKIVAHPGEFYYGPKNDLKADFPYNDVTLSPQNHFKRNRTIVDLSDLMFILPNTEEEQEYGGTWYTYRYAKKKEKPMMVVTPSGNIILHKFRETVLCVDSLELESGSPNTK